MKILIQKDDIKSKMWGNELRSMGVSVHTLRGSPINWIFFYMKELSKDKPSAIIFRYLNDYPEFYKTILRFFSEIITMLLAKLLGTKIIWICHNIDRETDVHYKYISEIRRFLIKKFARTIFVMDSLLVNSAKDQLKSSSIDFITFGTIEKKIDIELINKINQYIRSHSNNTIFGLTIGSINYKTIHFKKIPMLIESAKKNGFDLKMIVCGPIENYLNKHESIILEYMKNSENVYFINGYVNLDERLLERISFVFKSNLDLSVPLSYYSTVSARIPIIAIDGTFSAKLVSTYKIGTTITEDFSNIQAVFNNINSEKFLFDDFLLNHNWKIGAEKIRDIIKKDD
ncbi:hypothetical protein [Galbibacter sp. PAP.153]|uniref:hypothetical protein n=1 Tax=Galbibacter sp. PAP.153 TaxID=3104623 RepID=UPI00300A85B3